MKDRSHVLEHNLRRSFDLLIASVTATAMAPLFALVALTVRWLVGRPVVSRQYRAGRGGAPFTLGSSGR